MKIEDIAKIVYEANKAYCESIGDFSQAPWHLAEGWQKGSTVAGVQHVIDNPDTTPEDSHESWLKMKEAEGWEFGLIKNPDIKRHPCMVPYDKLPPEQRIKDLLLISIANALIPELTSTKFELPKVDKPKEGLNPADQEAVDMDGTEEKKAKKKQQQIEKVKTKLQDTSK